jgi:hypothetical protein
VTHPPVGRRKGLTSRPSGVSKRPISPPLETTRCTLDTGKSRYVSHPVPFGFCRQVASRRNIDQHGRCCPDWAYAPCSQQGRAAPACAPVPGQQPQPCLPPPPLPPPCRHSLVAVALQPVVHGEGHRLPPRRVQDAARVAHGGHRHRAPLHHHQRGSRASPPLCTPPHATTQRPAPHRMGALRPLHE